MLDLAKTFLMNRYDSITAALAIHVHGKFQGGGWGMNEGMARSTMVFVRFIGSHIFFETRQMGIPFLKGFVIPVLQFVELQRFEIMKVDRA